MRRLQLKVAFCLVATTTSWAAGTHWNAVTQFSFRKNPSGPWSYSTNALPLKTDPMYCVAGVKGWFTYMPIPNAVGIVRNYSGTTATCQTIQAPVDHLWMDPENDSATVKWTAPAGGSFKIQGDFLGIDTVSAAHPVMVTGPGGMLFSGTISGFGNSGPFSLKVSLAAGQSIAFTVVHGSGYSYLSTGLKAKIVQN